MDGTELIDRYVERVVRLLPPGLRERTGERLRADVLRRVAERTGRTEEQMREAEVPEREAVEVLREMGSPETVAAAVRPRGDWLIAPYLMPRFVTAASISLAALVVLTLSRVLTGPGGITGEEGGAAELLLRFVASLDDLLLKAVVVFAGLVGLFVFMDRTVEAGEGARGGWDPQSLWPSCGPDRVDLGSTALGLALVGVALAWVNTFPGTIGGILEVEGERGPVPLLVPWIRRELIWIDVWLVGMMARNAALLYRGRWTPALRWGDVVLTGLFALILWRASGGGPLFGVDAAWMLEHGWSREAVERFREVALDDLEGIVRTVLRWSLVVVLSCAAFEIYQAIRTTIRDARRG